MPEGLGPTEDASLTGIPDGPASRQKRVAARRGSIMGKMRNVKTSRIRLQPPQPETRFEYYQRRRVLPVRIPATRPSTAKATATIVRPPPPWWRSAFRWFGWAVWGAHELYDHALDIIGHIEPFFPRRRPQPSTI